VVLLDLSLPDSSGLGTVQACRRRTPRLPIIVLTGTTTGSSRCRPARQVRRITWSRQFDEDALIRAMRYAISRAELETPAETGTHLRTLINAMPDIGCFKEAKAAGWRPTTSTSRLFQLEGRYRGKKVRSWPTTRFLRESFLGCEASDEEAWRAGACRERKSFRVRWHCAVFDSIRFRCSILTAAAGLVVVGRDIRAQEARSAESGLRACSRPPGRRSSSPKHACNIVAINPAFTKITVTARQRCRAEPRILQVGAAGERVLSDFWRELSTRGEWRGSFWNKRKNGEIYHSGRRSARYATRRREHALCRGVLRHDRDSAGAAARRTLSWRDPLTGLANRAFVLRQLEQTLVSAKREKHFADVLLLDLDRFKEINEARGTGGRGCVAESGGRTFCPFAA